MRDSIPGLPAPEPLRFPPNPRPTHVTLSVNSLRAFPPSPDPHSLPSGPFITSLLRTGRRRPRSPTRQAGAVLTTPASLGRFPGSWVHKGRSNSNTTRQPQPANPSGPTAHLSGELQARERHKKGQESWRLWPPATLNPRAQPHYFQGLARCSGIQLGAPRGYRGHTRLTSVFPAQPQKPAGSGRTLEVEEGKKRGSFGANKGLGAGRTCFA